MVFDPTDASHLPWAAMAGFTKPMMAPLLAHFNNLPSAQFYRAVDNTEPFYFVYGGAQDNGSAAPSRT
jgi:hypothetical protein